MYPHATVRLEPASVSPPLGLAELLAELGDGERGFGRTPVPSGAMSLAAYLQRCCDLRNASRAT